MKPPTKAIEWERLSDRTRDALVAANVMGWTDLREEKRYYGSVGSARYTALVGKHPEPDTDDEVPAYTTDISAAWQVFDVVAARQRDYVSESWVSRVEGAYGCGFHVSGTLEEIETGETLMPMWVGFASTAPEAIAIAALRSVGVEVST